ncbi:MAG TPA: HAMP domain-containing sensor histidine kinase [Chloroflexota bacterium]|nr:HAMP domain-containing sensor histidine kinase [Chloroflexota bacterium]
MLSCLPDESPDTSPSPTSYPGDTQATQLIDTRQVTTAEIIEIVIHQLSTPITSLLISSEILLTSQRALQPDENLGELRRIRRNAHWLQTLLENLKFAANLTPLVPHWDRVSPSECVDNLLSLIQPVLERRQQEIVVTGPPDAVYAWGDRQWIEQILMNLLENASKYSEFGSAIQIAVMPETHWIRVSVQDSGPGISPTEQEQIFRPYVRGTSAEQAGVTGLGLGLHVVRSLVNAHRGMVGVDSQSGRGASFWFTLPRWYVGNQPPALLSSSELS